MTNSFEVISQYAFEVWQAFFLVFVRIGACVSLLPAFGERSVSTRVKLAIAVCFTIIVYAAIPKSETSLSFVDALFSETVTGLAFGIGIRLFIISLQIAGVIAAQSTSLSQLMGGAAADPIPAMGHLLVVSGIALAVLTGLHIKVAQLLIFSFDLVPLGAFPNPSITSEWGVKRIGKAFGLAFSLAAPFILLSVLYNLALGAINKAMPQLMVAFVGAPLITAGGLFILLLSSPIALSAWLTAFDTFLAEPESGF